MDRYIGMDTHSQSCTVQVLTPGGKNSSRLVVATNGAALVQAIRSVPGTKHLCIEEGVQSAWLYELLEKEVDELVVAMPVGHRGQKDDATDALRLAEGLRTGSIRQRVYKSCGPYSELRSAVKAYSLMTRDLTRAKNRLKALYRGRGIETPGTEVYSTRCRSRYEKALPSSQRSYAALVSEEIDALSELWVEAKKRLEAASKPHKIIKLISTAPGIGPIRAAEIVAAVVTPHRFRTSRQFWAYCGLGVTMRSSSDWVRDGSGHWVRSKRYQTLGLNRNRKPALKSAFKGAAHVVATSLKESHPLGAAYQRLLDNGVKPNLAQLTIARRIAAAVLAMWRHGEVYDSAKQTSQTIAPT